MMSCACFRLAGPVSHTERFSLYHGNSCPFKPKICQSPVRSTLAVHGSQFRGDCPLTTLMWSLSKERSIILRGY